MVDKAKFGERRACFACGCKFYDMHRAPPTCPRCRTDVSNPPKAGDEVPFAAIEEEEEEVVELLEEKAVEVEEETEPLREEEETEE